MESRQTTQLISILTLVLFSLSFSFANADELSLKNIIVGTWCGDPEETGVCVGYTVYYEDGRTYGYGSFPQYNIVFESQSEYEIDGNVMCVEPVERLYKEYSTGKHVELDLPLFTACSETIELSPKEITYKWVLPKMDEPRIKTMRKVSDRALKDLPLYVDYEAVVE